MSIPDSVQTFPQDQAFAKVLEQMLLRSLQVMQQSGELVWRGMPAIVSFGEINPVTFGY